jgi:hypothetical protein
MTQEEKDATNAALLLEGKINERVWQIIEKDPWRMDALLFDAIRRNRVDLRKYLGLDD